MASVELFSSLNNNSNNNKYNTTERNTSEELSSDSNMDEEQIEEINRDEINQEAQLDTKNEKDDKDGAEFKIVITNEDNISNIFDLKEISACLKSLKPGLKQTLILKINRQAGLDIEIDNPSTDGKSVDPIQQKEGKSNQKPIRVPPLQPKYQIILSLSW